MAPERRATRHEEARYPVGSRGGAEPARHFSVSPSTLREHAVPLAEPVGLEFHAKIDCVLIGVDTDDPGQVRVNDVGMVCERDR